MSVFKVTGTRSWIKLENVEHCGASLSELIMALMSWWVMTDVKFKFFMFSASWHDGPLTIWLHADGSSECDRLLTVYTLRLSSLACLTLFRSDRLPSCCSLWRQRCSLAPDAICLSHSVDSWALTYTVRSPLLRSIAQNFSTCANLKCTCTFVSIRKFSVYGHTQTDRQTDIHTRIAMQSREYGAHLGSPQLVCHKIACVTFPIKKIPDFYNKQSLWKAFSYSSAQH